MVKNRLSVYTVTIIGTQIVKQKNQHVQAVGEKHLMENKILLGFVMFSLMSVGIVSSYGEEQELTFISPFNPQTWGCTVIEDSMDYKQFDCSGTWKSQDYKDPAGELTTPAEDGCPNGMDLDIELDECRPWEWIEEEAIAKCEADIMCPRGNYSPPTPEEKVIEKLTVLKENEKISASDERLLHFLESDDGAKCFQGVGTTSGIQTERSFDIPTLEIQKLVNGEMRTITILDTTTVMTSLDFTGELKKIKMFVRECVAETVLLNPQGGVFSSADALVGFCDDIPNTSAMFNPVCGKVYKDHSVIASDIPHWSQSRVNQEANMNIEHDIFDIVEDVCDGYYTNTYKMTFQECRDIRDAKVVQSGGHVPEMKDYGHDLEIAVNLYKEDGGLSMAKEIAKEKIQEKIASLMKQIREMENRYK